MGSCVPFVFPWASLVHLLALGFLGPFTNFVFPWAFTEFIGLSRPNYFILILGVYGPAINPLLSLLALLWACRCSFLLFSHHTLPMGLLLAISLFSGSFEPICFLNAHLLISWTCDPLFLPLGLNGFCSLSFANFSSVYVAGLGFLPLIWVSQKDPQQGDCWIPLCRLYFYCILVLVCQFSLLENLMIDKNHVRPYLMIYKNKIKN